jgi:hypothetical protein
MIAQSTGTFHPTASTRRLAGLALALGLAVAAMPGRAQGEPQPVRAWKDNQGKEMMARFVEVKGGMVVLQRENGTKAQVSLMRLSAEDQAHARELAEQAKTVAPPGPGSAAAPARGGRDKVEPTYTFPADPDTIAYLPGSDGIHNGYYVYKPKRDPEPKEWPTLLVFPSHGGAKAELPRFQPAADELGWLVVFANDNLGNEPALKKRGAEFLAAIPRHLPVDRRRFYLAGSGYTFSHVTQLLDVERKTPVAGFLSTGGGGSAGPSFPRDAALYLLSPATTRDRYSGAAFFKRAGGKESRLVYFKSGEVAPPALVREGLIHLNALFFAGSAGKAPDYKAERDAFAGRLAKELAESVDFNPLRAMEVAGYLDKIPPPPDQLKAVQEARKKLGANPELALHEKFRRDFDRYVEEHLAGGYDEKKVDDQLKKMVKDADKLAEKYKDLKSADLALVRALSQKPER